MPNRWRPCSREKATEARATRSAADLEDPAGLQPKILTKVLLIFTDLYSYWAGVCFSKKVEKRHAE